jgi:methyltransferase (TIGR00027 family)
MVNATAASLTALGTALMRAVHSRLDPSPVLDDTWGEVLVKNDERDAILSLALSSLEEDARLALLGSVPPDMVLPTVLRRSPGYGMVVLRSRYAEDALATAVTEGVRQYVLVGAGMDSFSVRRPPWASAVQIFEVDLPATQDLKRRRMKEAGALAPTGLTFVATDLADEPLDVALRRNGFDAEAPSFFSWLGVTSYLAREANLRTLEAMSRCSGSGSQIVFTYIDQGVFETAGESDEMLRAQRSLARSGEPWVSGFHPSELPSLLGDIGFDLLEDLGGRELGERYTGASGQLDAPQEMRIACARRRS